MAKATFWQKGEKIDYVNSGSTAVENGQIVVLGTKVGVAGGAIAVGATGTLVMEGVFKMPKASGAAIAAGAKVYWDATNSVVTGTVGTNVEVGYAAAAAASADTEVLVSLG